MKTKTNKKVFLDLDGVLADFFSGVCKLHNLHEREISAIKRGMRGSYDFPQAVNLSSTEFWRHIDQDKYFWKLLDKTPEASHLMSVVKEYVPNSQIFFLTSPSLSPQSYSGKAEWVDIHFPHLKRNLIINPHKHLNAHHNHILIDDSDRHVNSFRKHNGRAILFPRPWNSKYQVQEVGIKLVEREFRRLI